MIEGSSIDKTTLVKVQEFIEEQQCKKVLVALDSCHTEKHVLEELRLYSKYVEKDSYVVVFDTLTEDMPDGMIKDRPWTKGNNPKTAVLKFLNETDRFEFDEEINNKLMITASSDGYLRCIK